MNQILSNISISINKELYVKDKLICLIEYDGIQHFKPYDYYGGEKTFENVKIRDAIKDKYCMDNNICLHRIPYTELDNINLILTEICNQHMITLCQDSYE